MIPKTAKHWNVIAKVMMTLSGVVILIGLVAAGYRYQWLQEADSTTGTIIELIERSRDDGGVSYAPVFSFHDETGQEHTIYSTVSSYPPVGGVGDDIPILYPRDNPKSARIDTFFANWGLATVAGSLGIFYLLIFAVIAIFTGRRMRRSEQGERGKFE